MKPVYKKYLTTTGLVWSACFVMFLFAYMLVLSPQRKLRARVEGALTEKKQVYEGALRASREETRVQLNGEIDRLQERLADFVIEFEDSANLTFDISQLAKEKDVGSFSIRGRDRSAVSPILGCESIEDSHIDLSFTGQFGQFAGFLNALERNRPVLFVDTFSITRSDQAQTDHRVNMDLAVFVKKQ